MQNVTHYVYFLIDNTGDICYVGRTVSPKVRLRVHERKFNEKFDLLIAGEFALLEEAQEEELHQISSLRPRLNTYLSSSPTRLGLKNTSTHNVALSRHSALRSEESRSIAAKKGWELRDKSHPHRRGVKHTDRTKAMISKRLVKYHETNVNGFSGKQHSEETKAKLRLAALRQHHGG